MPGINPGYTVSSLLLSVYPLIPNSGTLGSHYIPPTYRNFPPNTSPSTSPAPLLLSPYTPNSTSPDQLPSQQKPSLLSFFCLLTSSVQVFLLPFSLLSSFLTFSQNNSIEKCSSTQGELHIAVRRWTSHVPHTGRDGPNTQSMIYTCISLLMLASGINYKRLPNLGSPSLIRPP